MLRQSARLVYRVLILGAIAGIYVAGGRQASAAVSGGTGRVEKSAHATGAALPHALGATTAELFLCIGPAAACPSVGTVTPPPEYQPMLAMQFGQTWNGTMDAYANDGSPIAGTISLEDAYDGGQAQTLCTLNVAAGGTCDPSVGTSVGTAVGTHVLTAVYSGDGAHAGSNSPAVTIVVSQEATTATLTGAPNPAVAGQQVILTATVGGNYATPSGTVTFMYGGAVIGTANLAAGTGANAASSIATSTLPVGTDTITAVYASTTDFTSASATLVETITPAPAGSFVLSVSPDPVSIGVGQGALLNVTVTPANGFAQDVKLSCANLPQEATCQFLSPTIAGGSGMTSLFVQTTAPHSCGTDAPYFLGESRGLIVGGRVFGRRGVPVALPALAGVFALFIPTRRRRWLKLLIALAAVVSGVQMIGCGTCTDLGTPPATYSIEVTGTAAGGTSTPTVSQAVTVNVTI